MVPALSGPRERDQRELDLLMALGPALAATRNFADREMGRTYARASELCQELGDEVRGFAALRSLQLHYFGAAELAKYQHVAEEALGVAERLGDAARVAAAHVALGAVLYAQGKLSPARSQLQMAREKFTSDFGKLPDWSGANPAVVCEIWLALISWMLGYPHRSQNEAEGAVKSADALGHPLTLSQALSNLTLIPIFRHDLSASTSLAARAVQFCQEQNIRQFLGWSVCAHGWAICMSGETEKGSDQIERGLASYGPGSTKHLLLALQADVHLTLDRPEAALASAVTGLEVVAKIEGAPGEA